MPYIDPAMRKYQYEIIESLFSVLKSGKFGVANSPTMSTADGVVRSYVTPIARLQKKRGKWELVLSTKRYSMTTSSQQSALRYGASQYGVPVREVASL